MSSTNKGQIFGYVMAVLLLLTVLNSSYFFLSMLGLSVGKWLAFNACSLAVIAFLICFVLHKTTKKDYFLAIPILPLYYYGTMGLFVMPWNAANIFPQITHIIITINVGRTIYSFLKEAKYESLGKGFLIGTLIFVPIFAYIQSYNQLHIAEFMKLLQGL